MNHDWTINTVHGHKRPLNPRVVAAPKSSISASSTFIFPIIELSIRSYLTATISRPYSFDSHFPKPRIYMSYTTHLHILYICIRIYMSCIHSAAIASSFQLQGIAFQWPETSPRCKFCRSQLKLAKAYRGIGEKY